MKRILIALLLAGCFAQSGLAMQPTSPKGYVVPGPDDDQGKQIEDALELARRLQLGERLYNAVMLGKISEVERLLHMGANPNTRGGSADIPVLATALYQRDEQLIKLLLDHGADVNSQVWDGKTLLMDLISKEFDHVLCQLLIDYGADVNARDDAQRTILERAVYFGNESACRLLLDHGALAYRNPVCEEKGRSPLFEAFRSPLLKANYGKMSSMIRLLLAYGADMHGKNRVKQTGLMLAAETNCYETCIPFLNHCINKQVKPFFQFLLCLNRSHPHIKLPKDLRILLFNRLVSHELYPLLERKDYKKQSAYDIWPIEELNPEACMNTVAKLMLPPKMEQLNLQDEFRLGMPYLNSKATPYQVLGLADTASADDIKKAYRNLARIYHPDKFEDNKALLAEAKITTRDEATTAFQMISDAYDKLKPQ